MYGRQDSLTVDLLALAMQLDPECPLATISPRFCDFEFLRSFLTAANSSST